MVAISDGDGRPDWVYTDLLDPDAGEGFAGTAEEALQVASLQVAAFVENVKRTRTTLPGSWRAKKAAKKAAKKRRAAGVM